MKKRIIISVIVIFLIIVLGIYFAQKLIYLDILNKDYDFFEKRKTLEIVKTITLNKSENLDNNFLEFKNVRVNYDLSNFLFYSEQSNESSHKYILKDTELTTSFWMGTLSNVRDMFVADTVFFGNDDKGNYNKINRLDILKRYYIKSDSDFIKLLIETSKKDVNIFTKLNDLKEIYALRLFTKSFIPSGNSITLIEGDYSGFMFNGINYKEAYISHIEESYVFTFWNIDYFDENLVLDILNSIEL